MPRKPRHPRDSASAVAIGPGASVVPLRPTPPPGPGPVATTFRRFPFHAADLCPDDELRAWAMERAHQDVRILSVLPRRIRLFGERFEEVLELPRALAPDVAPGTGATLRALSARPGVERRLVEGWFAADGGGTAWILELGDGGAWWLATRIFERRPGGVGVWTSAWSEREGRGTSDLPEPLRRVAEPPAGERALDTGAPEAPPAPKVAMLACGTLPRGSPVPKTVEAIVELVAHGWDRRATRGERPAGVAVTVFRGRDWEKWILDGDLPMGLDDTVRAIAARGAEPTGIAIVHATVVAAGGEVNRALITKGEAQGRRLTRALRMRAAPDGTIVAYGIATQRPVTVDGDGWIGVPPISGFHLFSLGAGEG